MPNRNNYCVIMAGGIGSRFWPLSKTRRPKQFMDILGAGKSFIRSTYERFLPFIPAENFLVVTSEQYKDLVLEHIPELKPEQVLLEPLRRNTAPCIAYAAHRIAAVNPGANMVVTPSDHFIIGETEFGKIVCSGLDFVSGNDRLMTIGITPTRPETGYGYIQIDPSRPPAEGHPDIRKVKTFTEKPDLEMATVFLESGEFFWNSGIFIWSVPGIMAAMEKYLPDIEELFRQGNAVYGTPAEKEFIDSIYPSCENISIDYGVMEKSSEVFVQCGNFGWSDIGTWNSLYQHAPKDESGNAVGIGGRVLAYDTANSVMSVPPGKVAVIEGLDNYLVIDKDDVLLIVPRDSEQKVRNYVEDVKYACGEEYI